MRYFQSSATLLGVLSLGAAGVPGAARGDVTIEQQTQFDFAIVRMHGTDTEYTTSDKQRKDTDFHCEGMLSLVCGNAQSGEIVRLDRDLTWSLEPKKREYRETPFMTAAQRQAIQQEAQAALEKFKQCPAVQQNPRSAPDTSKCQMSPVKMDVKQTGTHQMFAGHDAQLTQIALTQSCTNRDTGDVCDFVYSLDSWLSQDQIPGIEDRQSFEQAYLRKLGLDDQNAALQKQVRQFLAPYSDMLKQLSGKAADLKGYPLKTAIRVSFGGEHCAAAAGKAGAQNTAGGGNVVADAGQAAGGAAASSAAGAAGSGAGTAAADAAGNSAAGSVLGSAASAFSSKLVSGLFAKKKSDTASPAAAQTSAAGGTPPPGTVQLAAITVETTAIRSGPVPGAEFEIPAGWKLIQPQPDKPAKEFSCPAAGASQ